MVCPRREKIHREIEEEVERQEKTWGPNTANARGVMPDFVWSLILGEEVGEVVREVLEDLYGKEEDRLESEIVQVAAVCVSWLESRRFKHGS